MAGTTQKPAPVTGLHGKLALVLGEMERVAKTGFNQAQNYKFAQEGDVADMIRASLASHGVSYGVTMLSAPVFAEIKSRSGTLGDRCHVHLQFTLTDADNPEDREVSEWWGYADDYQDKAVGKAVTGTKKSWLVARFLVSTGEPEPDGAGEQRQQMTGDAPQGVHPDTRPSTEGQMRRAFAMARERTIDPEFVRLSARLLTRTTDNKLGRGISELTQGEMKALWKMIEEWEQRPEPWDDRMGRLAAALAEEAEATAERTKLREEAERAAQPSPDTPPAAPAPEPSPDAADEPDDHQPTCTCGAGQDAPGDQHAKGCSMAIPF